MSQIKIQPTPGVSIETGGRVDVMSALDERYTHQQVAPMLVPTAPGPRWAERCFHSARLGADLQFSAGRAVYRDGNKKTGYVAVTTGGATHAVRVVEPFAPGDDADDPQVGAVRIEVVEPLREVRLTCEHEQLGLDLTYRARGPVVPTDRNLVEVRGELLVDYMNFYQSGVYSGTITIDGEAREVGPAAGFRDRGWGTRKHEGSPRRGIVLFGAHEFPEQTLWYLVYETASGKRVFTNGWLADADGVVDTATAIEHDVRFDDRFRCTGGELEFTFASGAVRPFRFEVDARNYLAAGGYSADPSFPALGYTRYDTSEEHFDERLNSQNDNGGPCWLDGVEGAGFLETGIGVHPRYRPEA